MTDFSTFTYQTRLRLTDEQEDILSQYASLFNQVERRLYTEVRKGKKAVGCKNEFLRQYGITARQFNACRVSLEGKIAARETALEQQIVNLKQKVTRLTEEIKRLEKNSSKAFSLHQKKRCKHRLSLRLTQLEKDLQSKNMHLCFGGKKLFHAQFYLEKNKFSSHQEWKKAWTSKRESEFFVLGSKDETMGNQSCTASLQTDGKLTLRLRLPHRLTEVYGKYLIIENVAFAYGSEAILASLCGKRALSYRFKKDEKSWKVFVSTDLEQADLVTQEGIGVIGIDLNLDHIACVETDRFGNLVNTFVIPWVSYGKTTEQLKALTGEVCRQIIRRAEETKKPIVLEKLDFQKKKTELKEKKLSRSLSSFAYKLFFKLLSSQAFKRGSGLHLVNPAYTSVIGSVNYAKRYGLSTHLAAALCIARRYQRLSERPSSSTGTVPDGKGSYVTFALPDRNRAKHVWHFWEQVKKKKSTVLAAHFRAIKNRSSSPEHDSCEKSRRLRV